MQRNFIEDSLNFLTFVNYRKLQAFLTRHKKTYAWKKERKEIPLHLDEINLNIILKRRNVLVLRKTMFRWRLIKGKREIINEEKKDI